MTSQAVQGILALAELMNFSKASAKLNITQPAFSRMISRVEEELGFRIFLRNTRAVSITREGEAFISSLRQAEDIYRTAVSYSREMLAEKNRLILGVTANFVSFELSPYVVSFANERPGIHLDCIPMPMEEIPVRLRSRGIDIGFLFTERTRFSTEFSTWVLKKIPLYVVVNKLHPLAGRSVIHPRELENESIITLKSDVGNHEFDSYGAPLMILNKKHGLHLEANIVAMSTQDQLIRVACNRGITLLTSTLSHILPENIAMIPLEDGVEFNLTAIWRRKEESRAMNAFLGSWNKAGDSDVK